MGDRVTRKQLAEQWGVTTQRIDAMIRQGMFKPGADKLIDADEANAARGTLNAGNVAKEREAKALGGQKSADQAPNNPIVQARTAEALYRARQRELIVKKLTGELVSSRRVKADAFEVGRIMGQALRVMPQRLAGQIAGAVAGRSPREVEVAAKAILEKEAKRIIADILKALEKVTEQKPEAA